MTFIARGVKSGGAATAAPALPPPLWRSWTVWSAAVLFYLFAYYVRVSPAVMTRELMGAFGIGAGSLGTLSATYFYAYVAMQIPTGILVDSWGARKLLVVGTLSAALGSLIFGWTGNFDVACLARGLVGGATAVAWVVTLKLITHWFPARRFAVLSGLSLFIGNLGALMAQIPLRMLVERYAWRPVTIASGAVLLLMAALALLLVRNDPTEAGFDSYAPPVLRANAHRSLTTVLKGLGNLFRYRNTWLIFFAQGGLLGPVLAFAGLWGPAYLSARYGLSPASAAGVDSVILLCFAVASPLMGQFSDMMGRRKPLFLGGATVAALGWTIMFYFPGLSLDAFMAAAGVTSFAAAAIILGFAFAKESVPEQYLGTISGLVNMSNQIGPMLLQPAIGWMLDRHWDGRMGNGTHIYNLEAFRVAFVLMVAWSLVSVVMLAFTRETYCRQSA
ncbi:MAG TPA: MFS transporter [Terriglobales bacterium]|nr:MFS transporter [Terriglobales bacterium]